MFKTLARCALFSLLLLPLLLPCVAGAEPIKLKLAFYSSDQSLSYLAGIKPFIDAVNSEASSGVKIDLYSSGALGKDVAQQPQLVLAGDADIAWVVTGLVRDDRFRDTAVIEMPGLFRDLREATLVFTRLIAAHALRGLEDFVVIGAYTTEPESLHGRLRITSLDDLKGKHIRVNNPSEAAVLEKLGASPVILSVTQTAEAVGGGSLDGAEVNPASLNDFGIKRVTTYHYMLRTGVPPLMLLMNRKKFESLPKPAQDTIRKYSGEWAAEQFIGIFSAAENNALKQLNSDNKRHVVVPTQSEAEQASIVFKAVVEEWAAKDPYNRALLGLVEAEIAKLRLNQ